MMALIVQKTMTSSQKNKAPQHRFEEVRGETMSDTVTQMRLSIRLDSYLREYMEKSARKATPSSKEEWEKVWQSANVARTNNTLTPELVDDVRIALNIL